MIGLAAVGGVKRRRSPCNEAWNGTGLGLGDWGGVCVCGLETVVGLRGWSFGWVSGNGPLAGVVVEGTSSLDVKWNGMVEGRNLEGGNGGVVVVVVEGGRKGGRGAVRGARSSRVRTADRRGITGWCPSAGGDAWQQPRGHHTESTVPGAHGEPWSK